jgi:hypothetical protein
VRAPVAYNLNALFLFNSGSAGKPFFVKFNKNTDRKFDVKERMKIEFRADATNATNSPAFNSAVFALSRQPISKWTTGFGMVF